MRAYKGLVKNGKVVLSEGAKLPEGAVVTVTISEAEYIRAKLQDSLKYRIRYAGIKVMDVPVGLATKPQ